MVKLLSSIFRRLSLPHWLKMLLWQVINTALIRARKIDYVQFNLPASLPPLPEQRGWLVQRLLGERSLSIYELDTIFERIVADPRPRGIILYLQGMDMPMAHVQMLRRSLLRLRESGKQVICFAKGYDLKTYYLASAADKILLQPGGSVWTLGLYQQRLYLKDSLEAIGVELEAIAISPYKGAADPFTLSEPSPEGDEQANWLLDSAYDTIVADIAAGRDLDIADVHRMVDGAPYTDEVALAAGYIDGLANEEDFSAVLAAEHIVLWEQAERILQQPPPRQRGKHVLVLPLSGMIMDGTSRKPPVDLPIPFVGGERMGDQTVVAQVRQIMTDKSVAAVVLMIDSGGGSATASEAMTAALKQLAQDRPLVVYMGSVAASGGYYIATPAHWIICEPLTITGSIGVINARVVAGELRRKLRFNPVEYVRGANANLLSSNQHLTPDQRAQMRQSIERIYGQFIQHVAEGRGLSLEAVDAVGGGRVWTGTQALEHGLCDQLGGLSDAIEKARQLAQLPADAPVRLYQGKTKPLPVQLAESNPAAGWLYLRDNMNQLANGKPQLLMPENWLW